MTRPRGHAVSGRHGTVRRAPGQHEDGREDERGDQDREAFHPFAPRPVPSREGHRILLGKASGTPPRRTGAIRDSANAVPAERIHFRAPECLLHPDGGGAIPPRVSNSGAIMSEDNSESIDGTPDVAAAAPRHFTSLDPESLSARARTPRTSQPDAGTEDSDDETETDEDDLDEEDELDEDDLDELDEDDDDDEEDDDEAEQ
jgi:hypothetical protein